MTVVQRGYDSSGRPIYATERMWEVWDAACQVLGFVPTIVQGGWVGDNGAEASAATHQGDAFDVRLWDRTATERARMIHVLRGHAFAYWERTEAQGFDPHAHLVPGPWASPAPQALDQWHDYLNGRDGLAYHRPDYHPRPNPLVITPPKAADMPLNKDDLNAIENIVGAIVSAAVAPIKADLAAEIKRADKRGSNVWKRDVRILKEMVDAGATLDELEAYVDKHGQPD